MSDTLLNAGESKLPEETNLPLKPVSYTSASVGMLEVGSAKYPQSLWISLYGSILTAIVIVVVSSLYYYETKNLFQKIQSQELELDARYITPVITDTYNHITADLTFLSRTPPIQGIIQSLANNDGELNLLWRTRLNTLFTEMIKTDQSYQEISYIKFGESQKTLVRVSTKNNAIFSNTNILPSENKKLPSYSQKSFEKDIISFQHDPDTNEMSEPHISSKQNQLSLTIPIFDKSNALFGAIVMKADFLSSAKLARLSLPGKSIFIMDNEGKIFISINSDFKTLKDGLFIQDLFPQLDELIADNKSFKEVSFENDESIGFYHTVEINNNDKQKFIRFFIKLNATKLNHKLEAIQYTVIIMALSLMLISVIVAFFIGKRLLKPLEQVTNELVRYGNKDTVGQLPVNSSSETGVLARSFHNMLLQKEQNDLALLQQKNALDVHAIVSISNVKGDILYVNDRFTHISGYKREELIGQNHRVINSGYHPREFFTDIFSKIAQGKIWQGEVCNRSKDGALYWERVTIVPFLNAKGKPEKYVSIRTDITENKKISEELSASRDILSKKVVELEEVNIELNQFAYIASHDLKSPLNGISQIVSWLEEDCKNILPKESQEHLMLLRNRTERMVGLLRDLLEYSKIGRSKYDVEKIYLQSFVEDIFTLLGDREGFTCRSPNVPLILPKVPFEVVIRNLITNAIKHHDKGKGAINIKAEQDNEFYFFQIIDDGPGILPAFQSKSLEMFQTLQSKDSLDSSGMGLAIVKKTIERYGGSLSIESDGKRGTCVHIKWPQRPLPEL